MQDLVSCKVCSVQKGAGIFGDNKANIFSIAGSNGYDIQHSYRLK